MKTAGRENPNRWAKASSNRAHGAAAQNRSCSIKWAAKQENVRPVQESFFLTSAFIELSRNFLVSRVNWGDLKTESRCSFSEKLDLLLTVSLLVVFGTFVDVLLTILKHAIDQTG